jgi:hypothetical protein
MDPKGRKAWCIDLEFSTRKKLVYEIAIVEYHTGGVVLDTLVKQGSSHGHWMVKILSSTMIRG